MLIESDLHQVAYIKCVVFVPFINDTLKIHALLNPKLSMNTFFINIVYQLFHTRSQIYLMNTYISL